MNQYPTYPHPAYTAYGPPNGYPTYYGPPGNPYPYAAAPPPPPGTYPQGTQPRTRTRRASESQAKPYREGQTQEARGRPAPQPQRSRATRQSEDIPRASRQNGHAAYLEDSSSRVKTDYLFVSLSSHDALKMVSGGSPETVTYLERELVRSWRGAFVDPAHPRGESLLRLGGDVWGATGDVGIRARKFVMNLFVLLAQEGFGYLTTFNNHPLKAPRLIFTTTLPDPDPRYFMLSFSINRRTVQIIHAPEKLAKQISASLRASVSQSEGPQRPTEREIDSDVIEVITSAAGGRVDLTQTMTGILWIISLDGWHLEANVAFGKVGLLGIRGRREAWLFRRNLDYQSPRRTRRQ